MSDFNEKPELQDLDAEIEAFEKSWAESNPEDDNVDETEIVEEVEETQDDVEVESPTEETKEDKPFQTDEQNRAFADMRRKLQEEQKYADLVRKLAEQNGTSPDKLLEMYQEQQLEKEAENQNVPVDVLKRLQSLEEENTTAKQTLQAERFNAQVEAAREKYGLDEKGIQDVFKFYHDNGLPPSVPFEKAYQLANLDTLTEQKVREAQQKELAEKKKRQNSTALPSEGSVSKPDPNSWTDDEYEAMKKELGLYD